MAENTENINEQRQVQEDEIDLLALAKQIWKRRVFIIIVTGVFFVLGLIVAITSSKVYTAETTFIVQTASSSSGGGNLAGLASLAGINLGSQSSGSEELSPTLYPMLISSTPFQLKLMKEEFFFSDIDKTMSLESYLAENSKPSAMSVVKKYTIGLPGLIFGAKEEEGDGSSASSGDKLLVLTKEEREAKDFLTENLSIELNDKDGYITLSSNTGNPVFAAQLVDKTYAMLQGEILDSKTATAKQKLEFVNKLYEEKKKEYTKAQLTLASYRDRHSNVISARAQTEEQRLENEYQLAFSVFSELAKQREQAKLKVQDDTPILKIVEPVSVPKFPSKPNKMLIIIIFIFLGGVLSVGFVFLQSFLSKAKERWKEI
ncbi:MAG: Wzz/FepE/Etk N-terminal domain-containing protein [Bacteroidales bacterium]